MLTFVGLNTQHQTSVIFPPYLSSLQVFSSDPPPPCSVSYTNTHTHQHTDTHTHTRHKMSVVVTQVAGIGLRVHPCKLPLSSDAVIILCHPVITSVTQCLLKLRDLNVPHTLCENREYHPSRSSKIQFGSLLTDRF